MQLSLVCVRVCMREYCCSNMCFCQCFLCLLLLPGSDSSLRLPLHFLLVGREIELPDMYSTIDYSIELGALYILQYASKVGNSKSKADARDTRVSRQSM